MCACLYETPKVPLKFANTPSRGVWSSVTRSTGINTEWPLLTASQRDLEFGIETIETDKVALSGYALLMLYNATDSITHPWVTPSLFAEIRPLLLNQVSQYSSLSLRISAHCVRLHAPCATSLVAGAQPSLSAASWCIARLRCVRHPLRRPTGQLYQTLNVLLPLNTLSKPMSAVALEHTVQPYGSVALEHTVQPYGCCCP
jgi:hypothetical protein